MARKQSTEGLPTLFDLSNFEAKIKPKHPDDIDTDGDGIVAWDVKPKQQKNNLKIGDWVKHQHKDGVGILIEISGVGTSVLGNELTFCRVEWIFGRPGGNAGCRCLPGELTRIERPDFLCNAFDGDTSDLLHKKIQTAVETLTLPQLEQLRRFIQALIDRLSEPELDIPVRSDREVVESRRVGSIIYQLERVKCGKNCRKCPHGPYWYAYYRRGGKVASKYIGKNLPG